ncbi:tRNA (adenine(58)-N(1))-methyltransferase non-catalytic subunit TRM6-like [Tigriopus californicus]|uniref:tRNA (adenine(58)-N(1))-methyltransferase non-catalytic subunit TRM6-like n=1 Tax=Tigriopus californicus TaxID=6832 RepID=UPI0027DA9216|nr:tRNA (adenine(58)-N(1))-methyltransferase non-catalytic subunit TRM6-like [Tigriopus californicus]
MSLTIEAGQVVILQKAGYARTLTFKPQSALVKLGQDQVDLSALQGRPFDTWFEMVPHTEKRKRTWALRPTDSVPDLEALFLEGPETPTDSTDSKDPKDNRSLEDINASQKLSKVEIEAMRDSGQSGHQVMAKLIENSDSFGQKTAFSQAKFLKKKAKKYHDFIQIRRPSIRLLMDLQYAKDPMNILNLRVDSLAQLLNMANVRSGGRYIILESGTQGLVVASALERLGSAGRLVHVYQTGCPQTNALTNMNFSASALAQIHTLNMFHLRSLEQGEDITRMHTAPPPSGPAPPRQSFRESSVQSYQLMRDCTMDGLILCTKQHPQNLLLHLMKYLAPSRPFAVFCPYKEPLLDTYIAVKDTGRAIMVTLSETWLRNYQVLPNRTHPHVMMSGGGGYLLTGIVVDNTEGPEFQAAQPIPDEAGQDKGRKNKRFKRSR